jgi:hypothetical protein
MRRLELREVELREKPCGDSRLRLSGRAKLDSDPNHEQETSTHRSPRPGAAQ